MTWDDAYDLAREADGTDVVTDVYPTHSAPTHPHVDRMPKHVMTGVYLDEWDAELVCVPECPACAVDNDLRTFWETFVDNAPEVMEIPE